MKKAFVCARVKKHINLFFIKFDRGKSIMRKMDAVETKTFFAENLS